ncbi:MAG: choice-of-anchor D domain-containing protein [Terracidiphilus sp.]
MAQMILCAGSFWRRPMAAGAAWLALAAATAGAQTNFGAVNVGASATASVTVTIPAAATLGSVAVVTQGATGLDFTNGGGGSCAAGTNYGTAQSCTVQVEFKPVYAGERYGAAQLLDGSGNVIASAPLQGNGVGPQVAFGGGAAIAFAPVVNSVAFNDPFDATVDGKGNLYITDQNNSRVVELPAGNGAPVAIDPIVGGKGLVHPGGVALDGAGNLYISDLDRNFVVEVPANGGAVTVINPTVNGIGLHYPCGMVIDGVGDLYIADVDNARVVEVPAGGGAAVAIDPLVSGEKLSYPVTLALDSAGDLFIADLFANRVVEVSTNGGAVTAIDPSVNGQSLHFPYGVAVDAAGDLFIADAYNRVMEVPAGGGATTAITPTVNGEGLEDPIGIGMDASGDLFIADSLNNRVVEIARGQPPAINFAATAAGTVSSDSPQTVEVENVGNAALTFPVPGAGANPAVSANFTLSSGATDACPMVAVGTAQPGMLAAGATCVLAISFQPAATGAEFGTLTLTDNHLNAAGPAYATQTIALSGAAPVATVSATMLAFGPREVQTASAPQQVTLTNTGSATLTITNIAVAGTNSSAFVFPNPCGGSLAAGASCTIPGHFTPAGAGPMTATLTITDSASGSPQVAFLNGVGVYPVTVAVTPSAFNVTTAQAFTVTVAVGGANGEPTPTGSVVLTSGTYNLGTAALASGTATIDIAPGALAVGTDNIIAMYAPDSASDEIYASALGENTVTVTASSTATAPATATAVAAAVTANTATLEGTVNPNGADTHAWFLWGTSSSLSGATQTAMQDLGATAGSQTVSANLTSLSASTTYYYQAVAENSLGTTSGAIFSFTTTPAPYFQMVTGAPMSVAPGAATGNTSTISVTPWYGFTGAVSMSCAITPTAASDPPTCNVPATVTVSGTSAQTATLTVTTTAASAMNEPMRRLWPGAGGAVLACVLLLFVPLRRRSWLALMAWVALFAAMAGMGCGGGGTAGGGGGGGGQKDPGTTAGTYTVTITGVSGGMTETGTVALTVQ